VARHGARRHSASAWRHAPVFVAPALAAQPDARAKPEREYRSAYAGRERRGGHLGWRGSTFWPDAYKDMWGYALAPGTLGETFWAFAYDDVFASIFWPPAPPGDTIDASGRPAPGNDRRKDTAFAALSPEFARICSTRTPGLTDWPFERIEQTLRPTGEQVAAYDELKAAANGAIESLRAACPTQTPSTPIARLDAVRDRLAAMRAAVDVVRPALERFYGLLDDEQKAHFNTLGLAANVRPSGPQPQATSDRRTGRETDCQDAGVPGYRERTTRHIEQVVRPAAAAQRTAFDDMKAASSQAAETLRVACPQRMPLTPVSRIDAIAKRLDAILVAVQIIRPALARFYDLLSDGQKARFNTMTAQND
jgi:hypothetical protein